MLRSIVGQYLKSKKGKLPEICVELEVLNEKTLTPLFNTLKLRELNAAKIIQHRERRIRRR